MSADEMWKRFIEHLNKVQPLGKPDKEGKTQPHQSFIGSIASYRKIYGCKQGNRVILSKSQQKEIKAGRAQVLACAHCGKSTYFGAMNVISLAIRSHKPVCSFECNKALGQVT